MAVDRGVKIVEDALREHFGRIDPVAYISVDTGYHRALHITVVSAHFEGMAQTRRYDEVFDVLGDVSVGKTPALKRVSLCMLFTPDEYRETYGEESPVARVTAAA
jgi:hypothetical protein